MHLGSWFTSFSHAVVLHGVQALYKELVSVARASNSHGEAFGGQNGVETK